jgi:hypothetical protein
MPSGGALGQSLQARSSSGPSKFADERVATASIVLGFDLGAIEGSPKQAREQVRRRGESSREPSSAELMRGGGKHKAGSDLTRQAQRLARNVQTLRDPVGVFASIWHVTPDAWTAIATWAAVCVAAGAATVAIRQLAEARELRREQAQPYVAVFAEPTAAGPTTIDLVIKNFGKTAATDVRVTFKDALESAALRPEYSPITVPEAIPVLVPGQEWRTFWDTTQARAPASELPTRYTAEVRFKDSRGAEIHPYKFEIDWRTLVDRGFVTVYTEHHAAQAMREISQLLSSWKDAGALSVVSRDGDSLDKRRREEWEKRRREREAE